MIEIIKNKAGVVTGFRARIYDTNGKLKSSKPFKQKTLAKECERRMKHERDQAIASGIVLSEDLPFAKFARKWLEEKVNVRLGPSTQKYYEGVLRNHLLPFFKDLSLKEIRIERVNQLVRQLKDKGKEPKGINCVIGVLQGLMNDATQWQYIPFNPLRGLKPMKEQTKEFAFWSAPEIMQFLRANRLDPLYPLYVTALNTGMRRGELGGLKWDRIDFVRNQISITRNLNRYGLHDSTKTGKKRFIPMNPQVRQALEPLWKLQRGEFVFSNEDGSRIDVQHMARDFKKAQKKAGFTSMIRFHDLRHTFASNFMMNSGNIYDLQKILGHSSLDMTQRYAHLSPSHLERAIRIVGFTGYEESITGELEINNPNIILNPTELKFSLVN